MDILHEVQTWWRDATPETRAAVWGVGLALGAPLGGHVLGSAVARALRARNFDAALRLPSSSPPGFEPDRGITPTLVAGVLVRLTAWAAAAWWLARQHERPDLAATLVVVG